MLVSVAAWCIAQALRGGDTAVIVIRDRGMGIPTRDQERIFERYERGEHDSGHSGFGLGLFIVREIVTALAGTVQVESAPGLGATFTVVLPLTQQAVTRPPSSGSPARYRTVCALARASRSVYARPMFEPKFVEHRGARILRLEFSHLSGPALVAAADQVRGIVAAEPLRSVRTLSILSSKLTAEGADALKQCALANQPYVRAGAVVGSSFWRVVATDLQVHGRPDLTIFDDEASALEWLANA